MACSFLVSLSFLNQSSDFSILKSVSSIMFLLRIVTPRAALLKRLPSQVVQGDERMKPSKTSFR